MSFTGRPIDGSNSLLTQKLQHYAKVGLYLEEAHRNQMATTGTVILRLNDDTLLPVDAGVAGAHSDYFRELVLKHGPNLYVDVPNGNPEAVKRAVDFMYSGNSEVELDELGDLLHVARAWQIRSQTSLAEGRLAEYTDQPSRRPEAFDIAATNENSVCASARSEIFSNVERDFHQLVRSKDFTNMSARAVYALLSSDDLPVCSELEVASAVLTYVAHPANRAHADQMFYVVRFEHLDTTEAAALKRLVRDQQPTLEAHVNRLLQTAKTLRVMRPRRQVFAVGHPIASNATSSLYESQAFRVNKDNQQTPMTAASRRTFEYSPYVQSPSQECLNRDLHSILSAYEYRNVPDLFQEVDCVVESTSYEPKKPTQKATSTRTYSIESLAELLKLPDPFGGNLWDANTTGSETSVASPLRVKDRDFHQVRLFSAASLRELPAAMQASNVQLSIATGLNNYPPVHATNSVKEGPPPDGLCFNIISAPATHLQPPQTFPLHPATNAQPLYVYGRL
ncbi:BTB/Kelch-associated [Aphelenchoides avenae]|nr:BTB/Kelch-associated [Aphelenchus avenae]